MDAVIELLKAVETRRSLIIDGLTGRISEEEKLQSFDNVHSDSVLVRYRGSKLKNSSKTEVKVYDLMEYATLREIFTSFGRDLDELAITYDQMSLFAKKYPEMLSENGYATMFLIKTTSGLEVGRIHHGQGGTINLHMDSLDQITKWPKGGKHAVVIPA